MRLMALWWWIDRWRKSTAYMDMTLAEQGAYRNLLDEAHLRGGPLPLDERILAKACGDALAWPAVRVAVMARFIERPDGWHNATLDEVMHESERRAQNQANYRARRQQPNNTPDNGRDNATDNNRHNRPASPSPSPSPSLISGSGSGSRSKPSAESAPSALDVSFSEFWLIYPKKTGKAAALKVWKKIHPSAALCATMRAAVSSQAQSDQWQKAHGQFIPNPATWLNQGRWDDEPVNATEPAREPGTWIGGFRVEDMVRTPEEVAAAEEWEKVRARYR